jgi:hypothetical protein
MYPRTSPSANLLPRSPTHGVTWSVLSYTTKRVLPGDVGKFLNYAIDGRSIRMATVLDERKYGASDFDRILTVTNWCDCLSSSPSCLNS